MAAGRRVITAAMLVQMDVPSIVDTTGRSRICIHTELAVSKPQAMVQMSPGDSQSVCSQTSQKIQIRKSSLPTDNSRVQILGNCHALAGLRMAGPCTLLLCVKATTMQSGTPCWSLSVLLNPPPPTATSGDPDSGDGGQIEHVNLAAIAARQQHRLLAGSGELAAGEARVRHEQAPQLACR